LGQVVQGCVLKARSGRALPCLGKTRRSETRLTEMIAREVRGLGFRGSYP
jgi:hypothetical protein